MLTKSDLKEIDNVVSKRLQNVTTKDDLKRELKPIKSDVAKTRKDIDVMLSIFDREYLQLRKGVERIEEHLGLETISP
ncbi:MAG: hypothetical protein US60_C0006G0013 [Microgenomates group bacterium GW2011_GWC1_37_8]|uniref:Uncharacterized protein n=1 Tax=Candidatus Woesebacteria bacterium GW2011_GWB1_38_8 TaxID=1618570 RepID=A0A0G0P737_9BACT|nr:MAG: hypothetical protein US60_C0006G0013 [Microgenomates group bacterium GW2011_GWC1_37_8]KKQ85086.1 MAG: hypothetical protein UT08_C0010G0013 [Candidatus Woesebacteria bacterium GW2011_GWB1_38_8]